MSKGSTFPNILHPVPFTGCLVSPLRNQNEINRAVSPPCSSSNESLNTPCSSASFGWKKTRGNEGGETRRRKKRRNRGACKPRGTEKARLDGYINRTVRTCTVESEEFTLASNDVPSSRVSGVMGIPDTPWISNRPRFHSEPYTWIRGHGNR